MCIRNITLILHLPHIIETAHELRHLDLSPSVYIMKFFALRGSCMQKKETVYGFVPARKGSEGVPNKNLRTLEGKTLVARAVETLRAAGRIERVILSTDHEAIAQEGRKAGAEVPFLRPPELATAASPVLSALQHALGFLQKQGREIDRFVMIQPSSPFVTTASVEAALERAQRLQAPLLQSVCTVKEHPYWVRVAAEEKLYPFHTAFGSLRRQDLPELFILNGAINIYATETIESGRLPAFPCYFTISRIEGIDIDDETDWKIARALAEAGLTYEES